MKLFDYTIVDIPEDVWTIEVSHEVTSIVEKEGCIVFLTLGIIQTGTYIGLVFMTVYRFTIGEPAADPDPNFLYRGVCFMWLAQFITPQNTANPNTEADSQNSE